MKLTEWYPANIKPVRVGVYQISPFCLGGEEYVRYSMWNGAHWSYFAESISTLLDSYQEGPFHTLLFEWRGLAQKPKGAV